MSRKKSPLDPAGLTGTSRRQFLKYTSVLGAAAGIAASVSACGPSSGTSGGGGGKGGGSSTISATLAFQLSGTLDPDNHSSAVATAANQHIFEALVDLDPATRAPYLALAKAQPKASADGLKWTVELRDGAKFSDGSAVTGEDVAWSFTRALDPATLMSQFISFITSVKATGATSAEFTLKEPFPLFPTRISVIKIVPKAKTKTAALAKTFGDKPIGSGPWVLDSADPNSGLTFSVNKHYNGSYPAKATKMVWHTTTQDATRIADLQSGRSQAIEAVPFVNVKQLEKTKKVEAKQAFNQIFLMFNCAAKPFDDKRVRQALHYAIDTDAIIKTAFQGYATAAQNCGIRQRIAPVIHRHRVHRATLAVENATHPLDGPQPDQALRHGQLRHLVQQRPLELVKLLHPPQPRGDDQRRSTGHRCHHAALGMPGRRTRGLGQQIDRHLRRRRLPGRPAGWWWSGELPGIRRARMAEVTTYHRCFRPTGSVDQAVVPPA